MKIFDLQTLATGQGGEYALGMKDLHSRACYMVFGFLRASEGGRLVKPGKGHEEILCAVGGPITMHTRRGDVLLAKGHAIHVKEDESFLISNPSDEPVAYIVAGGRVDSPQDQPDTDR